MHIKGDTYINKIGDANTQEMLNITNVYGDAQRCKVYIYSNCIVCTITSHSFYQTTRIVYLCIYSHTHYNG